MLPHLAELFLPSRCLACGVRAPLPWCTRCSEAAERHRILEACSRCAAPGATPGHRGCWPEDGPIVSTSAAFRYRDVVADSVVTAKVRGVWAGWPALGEVAATVVPDGAVVSWVPTTPARRRARGFDHAELLARALARRTHRVVPLLRACDRADQATRDPRLRHRLPAGSFVVAGRPPTGPVALVDDVLTTGGTAWAAAAALGAAGVSGVHLSVLARAGEHDLGRVAVPPRADLRPGGTVAG